MTKYPRYMKFSFTKLDDQRSQEECNKISFLKIIKVDSNSIFRPIRTISIKKRKLTETKTGKAASTVAVSNFEDKVLLAPQNPGSTKHIRRIPSFKRLQ